MTRKWTALAAGFAALILTAPCALATEADWAYRRQRAEERSYEQRLRRQAAAERIADRLYGQRMRRLERAAQHRAYLEAQREYRREQSRAWRGYRDTRIF